MAPNKLEDRIREQLQEREIQPSKDAWDKLEARLGNESKSAGSYKIWYAVAASFVGILILASVFFNNDQGQDELVVEDEKVEIPAEVNDQVVAIEDEQPARSEEERVNDREVELAVEETKQEVVPQTIQKTIAEQPDKSPLIAEVKTDEPGQEKVEKQEPLIATPELEEERFIQSKVDEVVAEVGKIQESGVEIKAEDIDQLLLNAQKEISKRRILNSETKKVDAAALLSDVEIELERSFRDKVFDALGDGFNKIRTAVAERNY